MTETPRPPLVRQPAGFTPSGDGGPPPSQWRRLPVGAEVMPGGAGVHFRVWAPRRGTVRVVLEGCPGIGPADFELTPEEGGYHSGTVSAAGPGALYRLALDDDPTLYPDPASRFQPDGPHGPSQVVDPAPFPWTDADWRGVALRGQAIYEMHVGTFTRAGTWVAAIGELPELADLGVTVIEMMPVADFPGRFGWGYDGVDFFAPTRLYGTPDDLRLFVDSAHALGMGVILDVVYNHIGSDGNYLPQFSASYTTDRYSGEWGEPINFDGPNNGPVREFHIANAGYWIDEFHFDGLRLDATQDIHDASRPHILAAIGGRVREAARGRATIVVAENEAQQTRLVRPLGENGYGLDGLWNDDFHHSAMVAMTGRAEAYYMDYRGRPQEFVSAAKWGYLYQGQWYAWQRKWRGSSTRGIPPAAFVTYLQNHDQIANTGRGRRAHRLASPGVYRALTAAMLLGPGTPMLFQGQEFAASAPFTFFADPNAELAPIVRGGRAQYLAQFPSLADPAMQAGLFDPTDPATFEACKLDFEERRRHAWCYALHRDLLRLRREEPAFNAQRPGGVDGAVLGDDAFVLRFFAGHDGLLDRLLVVNLGRDLDLPCAPEPLLAPPEGHRWERQWSSETPLYGAEGAPPVPANGMWRLPGYCAVVMRPGALADG